MSKIPEWASQDMEEANVDAEGWVYDPEDDCMEYVALPHGGICLNKRGEISVNDLSNITAERAFRLADRLRRALTGEPDPRVAELEAEVERLKTEVQELKEYKHIWHDPQLHHYNLLRCPVIGIQTRQWAEARLKEEISSESPCLDLVMYLENQLDNNLLPDDPNPVYTREEKEAMGQGGLF